MGSAFFFKPQKGDHSSQRVLSTSYTEMTDNLTDSEQEKVLKVSSRTSKKIPPPVRAKERIGTPHACFL